MISTRSSPSSRRLGHDRVQIDDSTLGKGVGGVAVDTSQVAGGQTDKNARQARERAFPLQAAVDLMDEQAAFGLIIERLKPVAMTRGE